MTADKAVYKCPKCGYVTHFKKALEAHMRFRKHFADGGNLKPEKPEKPVKPGEYHHQLKFEEVKPAEKPVAKKKKE